MGRARITFYPRLAVLMRRSSVVMEKRKFRFSRLFLSIIGSMVFLLFAAVEKSFEDKDGTLPKLFGEETTRTDYVFRRTMLDQTPDKLKPWMNERQAHRVSFLLMIKGISSVGGETGVFHVEDKGWKGF